MNKVALITGITGQDGSYLAEFLLEKSYRVYGIVRRNSFLFNLGRIAHIEDRITLRYCDMTDASALSEYILSIARDNQQDCDELEIYNLAAQSHVQVSFEIPGYTSNVDALGTLHILQAILHVPEINVRFYQASTSELYGRVLETPQRETTPFNPCSPYAVAKLYAYHMTKVYRETYGMYAVNGILFNHESARRGQNFVTMKIVNGARAIARGEQTCLELGNLDAKRDWGWAVDYVRGMWLMLQQDEPRDFVLATGKTYTVREFVERAFAYADITITWSGDNIDEVGCDDSGRVLVKINPKYYRPNEVDLLLGDPSLAEQELGWTRECDTLDDLIHHMFTDK